MLSLATLLVLFHVLVVSSASTQDIHYITPYSSSSQVCPSQPCLTLEQYTQQVDRYFTTGATFVFLEGNHSLHIPLELTHISNLSLTGAENDSSISIKYREYISFFNATNINIETLTFERNAKYESALIFDHCDDIYISKSVFLSGKPSGSSALFSHDSNITITDCLFEDNINNLDGGAIFANSQTNLIIIGNNFTRNGARTGGAIYASESSVILKGSTINNFSQNFCSKGRSNFNFNNAGGAIYCTKCTLNITGRNFFENNECFRFQTGGIISINIGWLAISGVALFHNNKANKGTIILYCFHVRMKGNGIEFKNSSMGIYMANSMQTHDAENNCRYCKGNNNSKYCTSRDEKMLISASFRNSRNSSAIKMINVQCISFQNVTITGGTIAISIHLSSVEFNGTNVFSGCERALSITYHSNVVFNGNTSIYHTRSNGVILNDFSSLSFRGYTVFHNNSGHEGGAVRSNDGTISFIGTTIFTNNTATGESDGGALYAFGTKITMEGTVIFSFNSAKNGGAMKLEVTSLMLAPEMTLYTSYNTATDYGGAIYHNDAVTANQCKFRKDLYWLIHFKTLPYCFLKFDIGGLYNVIIQLNIYSYNNTAGKDGTLIYGGLLDRCRYYMKSESEEYLSYLAIEHLFQETIHKFPKGDDTMTKAVASQPYQLCFCDSDQTLQCDNTEEVTTLRGREFSLSVLALGQNDSITPTTVTAVTSQNARLKDNRQSQQILPQHCSDLTYSIYSEESHINLILYPDGPCRDIGTARMVINVTLLPCPDAFTLEGDQCVCEERLQLYGANCTIGEEIAITRQAGSQFWMEPLYKNYSYEGLILYRTCPTDYCTTKTITITLDNLDIQCDHNRTGVLCGACATNYSLLLGSSRCDICSHHYLALLIPFALAGIALVVFLSCLRLTVATGFISSFILYANFIQANKIIFFPSNEVNVLIVFIAWLNLDLGFQTCFIPGLDAYTQTWLQFAFPLYVWILIGLIIFSSRYSITISKWIGRNPIAVLATLILMSYAKILRIIIEIFSSVKLDYPRGYKDVPVWLKDANVPYLQSKHLALSVVTLFILVLLFVPYTVLLLIGPCLYRVSHRRSYFFLRRIKPLLDSYYAPYKRNTRYWTGFLLLVRCALYTVFSFNSLGGTNNSLLAIIVTFTAIGLIPWYIGRIYRKLYMDVIEGSVYLNLIVLSASVAIITEDKKRALVYTLIAIVFSTVIGTILYQFHLLYIAKTATWLKMKAKLSNFLQKPKNIAENEAPVPVNKPTNPPKPVSKTFIELREPLLEN